jgi:adenylate kinase family enzyme
MQNDKHVILVFGKLCSGKGTFCKQYADIGYLHISTSDVVKMVSGKSTRQDLQTTGSLDQKIVDKMIEIIDNHNYVIIDGIRQCSIIERLLQTYPKVQMVWLEVDEDIRKLWFDQRGDAKDNITFDQAQIGDDKLGLGQVESKYKKMCRVVTQGER